MCTFELKPFSVSSMHQCAYRVPAIEQQLWRAVSGLTTHQVAPKLI